MSVRSGSSAVESGEETLVWSEYSGGTVTETFLTSETKPRIDDTCTARFNHRPLGLQPQVLLD